MSAAQIADLQAERTRRELEAARVAKFEALGASLRAKQAPTWNQIRARCSK